MTVYIVVPKRKMLRLQEDTVQPEPISEPASVVIPPLILSNLLIDTSKDWAGFAVENLGAARDNTGAARKLDLETAIVFIIDGGGSVITTGEKGYLRLPFNGSFLNWGLAADQSGSIEIDIWKEATGFFPPTVADSICAGDYPNLVDEQYEAVYPLTDWETTFARHDYLAFNVRSVSTVQRVTLTLDIRRT